MNALFLRINENNFVFNSSGEQGQKRKSEQYKEEERGG